MIIAEVGQNFCGNMELAQTLIGLAKNNGADLVKFQLYKADSEVSKQAELTKEQAFMLFHRGKTIGIEVFFSVFDIERVKWCEEIGVKRYKVACGYIHPKSNKNMDLAEALKDTGKEIIISYSRIPDGIGLASPKVKRLYCIPVYPALLKGSLFNRMDWGLMDGFSDHTVGLDASKIAIARGAEIIEKHFAIDHKTGVDAPWSMTPDELKELKRWESVCREVL